MSTLAATNDFVVSPLEMSLFAPTTLCLFTAIANISSARSSSPMSRGVNWVQSGMSFWPMWYNCVRQNPQWRDRHWTESPAPSQWIVLFPLRDEVSDHRVKFLLHWPPRHLRRTMPQLPEGNGSSCDGRFIAIANYGPVRAPHTGDMTSRTENNSNTAQQYCCDDLLQEGRTFVYTPIGSIVQIL